MIIAGPAFAKKPANTGGCDADKVIGVYTNYGAPYLDQLSLTAGGIANSYWTGFLDTPLSFGTQAPFIGSWECRPDGTILVSFLTAGYGPTSIYGPDDIELFWHTRYTFSYSVESKKLIRLIKSAVRRYDLGLDPSDPNAGVIVTPAGPENVPYHRFKPSDTDLITP